MYTLSCLKSLRADNVTVSFVYLRYWKCTKDIMEQFRPSQNILCCHMVTGLALVSSLSAKDFLLPGKVQLALNLFYIDNPLLLI